tara:strand:+ start:11064 stop:12908 length:1845 start_codon:yes stop_codon:yes gene_type:complete
MGGSPSNDDDSPGANIPTSKEEYEEAVGGYTPNDEGKKDYDNSNAKGSDEDLAYESGDFDISNYDYSDFGDDYDPESNSDKGGGWEPGDKVPSPGVYNAYNNTYTVDGNVVTKEEYDANQAAREDFVNTASDDTNTNFQEAYAEEMMRSDGRNPNDDNYKEDFDTYKSQAQDYYNDNKVTNEKLNELVNDPSYQKLDYQTQEDLKMGLGSNNKQMQTDAIKALGEFLGDGRRQNDPGFKSMLSSLLGGKGNINELQGYGQLSPQEYGQALVDGLNQGSGIDITGLGSGFDLPGDMFDFDGFKAFQGVGGTTYGIDANGNITVQTGGNNLASKGVNIGTSLLAAKTGGTSGLLMGGLDTNIGVQSINDFLGLAKGQNLGSMKQGVNVRFDPASVAANYLGGKIMDKNMMSIAKNVFDASGGNKNLTMGAVAGADMLTKEAISKAVESLDLNKIDLLGNSTESPTAGGGGNTKANVNISSSGETSTAQSDLKSGSGLTPDVAGETQLSQNLKSSNQSSKGGNYNDDGGNDDARSDFLKAMPETLDVNTLQNLNTVNTTPLTTMNNDASLMMNSIGKSFGGRYLQRGRNRDTGSVTTKRASQRDVDKDRRRSGILFG